MANNDLKYTIIYPNAPLSDFVESFWMLANDSDQDKECIVLPDGRIDILFSYSPTEPFNAMLMNLDTQAGHAPLLAKTVIFAVSFKLLALEYILHTKVANLEMPILLEANFWDISLQDLGDFQAFVQKISTKIKMLIPNEIDERKRQLFELIYAAQGSISVQELAQKSYWSSRQINRYFNQQVGISLKAYCTILRFRASCKHLSEGKLFPALDFTDQAHFIKEVKKFSGVSPKELSKNKDDKFVQISALKNLPT